MNMRVLHFIGVLFFVVLSVSGIVGIIFLTGTVACYGFAIPEQHPLWVANSQEIVTGCKLVTGKKIPDRVYPHQNMGGNDITGVFIILCLLIYSVHFTLD